LKQTLLYFYLLTLDVIGK